MIDPRRPISGSEIRDLSGTSAVYTFRDIIKYARNHPLSSLLDPNTNSLIALYEWRPGIGHWVGIKVVPELREAYFFSSYGNKPDTELNYLTPSQRRESGQAINLFNNFLKGLFKQGWTIYYNDYPYQKRGDGTATCGRWLAKFLRSGLNPDEFEERIVG